MTWSPTTEWCFYLLVPLGLMLARSTRMRGRTVCRCLWAGAVLLFAVALTMGPTLFYFLPVANLGVMLLGGALALRSSPQGWCRHETRARRMLGCCLLSGLGIRAYSIDLLHLPVLWPVWFNTQGKPVWLVLLLILAVLISVAELSYRLLERPVMRGVQAGSAGAFGRVARTGSPV